MKVWTSRMLAVSLAGHDKGMVFVVLEERSACTQNKEGIHGGPEVIEPLQNGGGSYYLLADGRHRTLDCPKKKKAKHVQEVTHLPDEILAQMKEITLDAHVRRIIKEYQKYQQSR